jgi:hypothetical protein
MACGIHNTRWGINLRDVTDGYFRLGPFGLYPGQRTILRNWTPADEIIWENLPKLYSEQTLLIAGKHLSLVPPRKKIFHFFLLIQIIKQIRNRVVEVLRISFGVCPREDGRRSQSEADLQQ